MSDLPILSTPTFAGLPASSGGTNPLPTFGGGLAKRYRYATNAEMGNRAGYNETLGSSPGTALTYTTDTDTGVVSAGYTSIDALNSNPNWTPSANNIDYNQDGTVRTNLSAPTPDSTPGKSIGTDGLDSHPIVYTGSPTGLNPSPTTGSPTSLTPPSTTPIQTPTQTPSSGMTGGPILGGSSASSGGLASGGGFSAGGGAAIQPATPYTPPGAPDQSNGSSIVKAPKPGAESGSDFKLYSPYAFQPQAAAFRDNVISDYNNPNLARITNTAADAYLGAGKAAPMVNSNAYEQSVIDGKYLNDGSANNAADSSANRIMATQADQAARNREGFARAGQTFSTAQTDAAAQQSAAAAGQATDAATQIRLQVRQQERAAQEAAAKQLVANQAQTLSYGTDALNTALSPIKSKADALGNILAGGAKTANKSFSLSY